MDGEARLGAAARPDGLTVDEALEELLAELAGGPRRIPERPPQPARPRGSQGRAGPPVDAEKMIREGRAMVARIEADRQARYERNAPQREYAWRVYQQKRAEFAAARSRQGLTLAAAAWWDPPAPIVFW